MCSSELRRNEAETRIYADGNAPGLMQCKHARFSDIAARCDRGEIGKDQAEAEMQMLDAKVKRSKTLRPAWLRWGNAFTNGGNSLQQPYTNCRHQHRDR